MNDDIFDLVKKASRNLAIQSVESIDKILMSIAELTIAENAAILAANQKDLDRMPESDPRYDRLKLTEARIAGIASELKNVAALASPLNKILQERTMPNGLKLQKITVPLGVVGIIYESRPNVTFDVFALCLKAGNACVLKGGSDAAFSNEAIVQLIKTVLRVNNADENIITLLEPTREAASQLLNAVGFVDVIIPRGSQNLINFVRENAKVPVIETGAGIVHAYFDEFGSIEKGAAIINNSKTRRVSVCNALDCLLVHESSLQNLPALVAELATNNVILYADNQCFNALQNHYPKALLFAAEPAHFGLEFLDYKMAIKAVSNIYEAIEYIAIHSSKHSEVIISENEENLQLFTQTIDAAVVYANASTAFTDGAQFGLGAEIGISTQKLHARGPMALNEITSYKWIVTGNGQIRNN